MFVSIITPTIRKEGLTLVQEALKRQTHTEFEWLIGSKFDPQIPEAIWVKDEFEGGFWSLNRMYNKLFRQAKGELLISWQDWIWVPPDGVEKFVLNYENQPGIISGVGDQYERVGKFGKPEIKIWSDPRKSTRFGSYYQSYPNDIEWNWAAFPKSAITQVGGMDEGLDFLGYGGDQLQIMERLDCLGIPTFLDQTNESFTVRHSRSDFGGQEEWDKHHVLLNGLYDKRKAELMQTGKWPCVGYL